MKHSVGLVWLVVLVLFLSACSTSVGQEPPKATDLPAATKAPAATQPVMEPTVAPATEALPIEFGEGATIWYTNGDLAAEAGQPFVFAGLAGQQVTVWLSTDPISDSSNIRAALDVTGPDGQPLSLSPEVYWSSVLSATGDYVVEVRLLSQEPITYQIVAERSISTIDPAMGTMYDLIPDSLCQDLRGVASEALGVEFIAQTRAPFFDGVGGEAGQGCRLTAGGNGTQFSSPSGVVAALSNSVGLGWNPVTGYEADGPTGSAVGLARDMGLMLISANWQPEMGVVCPEDKSVSDCGLTPEQQTYLIQIDIAQYNATFSLDGHWVDAATGFTLDLYQDWKNIFGNHTFVTEDGKKIDSLDVSIDGRLSGQVATVQFQSSFTTDTGIAEITYIDVNTMQWKIIDPPDGEYYLPAEATLIRE